MYTQDDEEGSDEDDEDDDEDDEDDEPPAKAPKVQGKPNPSFGKPAAGGAPKPAANAGNQQKPNTPGMPVFKYIAFEYHYSLSFRDLNRLVARVFSQSLLQFLCVVVA